MIPSLDGWWRSFDEHKHFLELKITLMDWCENKKFVRVRSEANSLGKF